MDDVSRPSMEVSGQHDPCHIDWTQAHPHNPQSCRAATGGYGDKRHPHCMDQSAGLAVSHFFFAHQISIQLPRHSTCPVHIIKWANNQQRHRALTASRYRDPLSSATRASRIYCAMVSYHIGRFVSDPGGLCLSPVRKSNDQRLQVGVGDNAYFFLRNVCLDRLDPANTGTLKPTFPALLCLARPFIVHHQGECNGKIHHT